MDAEPNHAAKILERPREGRVVAGVAEFAGLDVAIVRALPVGLSFFSGLGVAIYAAACALLADSGATSVVPDEVRIRTWCRA
jgi:phage shock protein PspC (stress-responsive transcriptional regulator)